MLKNINPPKQKTRKKIWWLLFLIPIFWVLFNNVIVEPSFKMLDSPKIEAFKSETDDSIVDERYWELIDDITDRLIKLWPLIMSAAAFLTKRKIVGD